MSFINQSTHILSQSGREQYISLREIPPSYILLCWVFFFPIEFLLVSGSYLTLEELVES